jgi:hypothetical protein
MSRSIAALIAFAVLLSACGGSTETPLPTGTLSATPVGWSEPIDESFIVDPSTPFLAGELISYGYENSGELISRPAEFGGRGIYKAVRPQVLYSDGTEGGTRFLLEAVLEVGRNGPDRPLAVSDGTNGYFVATTWVPATEPCLSVDGATCPDDATALYWTDGVQSVKIADLARAGKVGSVRDIALVRAGERSAACLVRGSGGEPAAERLIVSCYEKGGDTPRELISEIPSGAQTELAVVGSRLLILSGVATTLFSWDPFTEGATEVALDAGADERPLDLIDSRSDDGSAPVTLFVSGTPSSSGDDQLIRVVALGERLAPIALFEERATLGESPTSYGFDLVRLGDTLYLRIGTFRDGEIRNRLISYDATALSMVSSGLDIYGGPFELLPVGETLWAVGERAVYEVARNGVVERDSRDETFDSPVLVPTGVSGEAYLSYRDLTSENPAATWFYLAPGAAAVPIVGLSAFGNLDPIAGGGRLYLIEPETAESTSPANLTVVEKTTASRLDLAPDGEGWSFVRLRAIAGRLVGAYTRDGEERDPDYVGGALVRLTALSPR